VSLFLNTGKKVLDWFIENKKYPRPDPAILEAAAREEDEQKRLRKVASAEIKRSELRLLKLYLHKMREVEDGWNENMFSDTFPDDVMEISEKMQETRKNMEALCAAYQPPAKKARKF
jgi:hypothetical protein